MFCCVFFTPSVWFITSTLWILASVVSGQFLTVPSLQSVLLLPPRFLSLQHGRRSFKHAEEDHGHVFLLTAPICAEVRQCWGAFSLEMCVWPEGLCTRQKAGVCLQVLSLIDHLIIGTLVACCRCLFTLLHCNQIYPKWQVGMLLK